MWILEVLIMTVRLLCLVHSDSLHDVRVLDDAWDQDNNTVSFIRIIFLVLTEIFSSWLVMKIILCWLWWRPDLTPCLSWSRWRLWNQRLWSSCSMKEFLSTNNPTSNTLMILSSSIFLLIAVLCSMICQSFPRGSTSCVARRWWRGMSTKQVVLKLELRDWTTTVSSSLLYSENLHPWSAPGRLLSMTFHWMSIFLCHHKPEYFAWVKIKPFNSLHFVSALQTGVKVIITISIVMVVMVVIYAIFYQLFKRRATQEWISSWVLV